jgi:hypothetical protein
MVNIKARDIKLFGVAAGRMANRLRGLDLLNRDTGHRTDTSTLIAANAVFSKKIQAIVAVFGEGGFFVGVGKGYAARSRKHPLINSRRAPAKSSPKVF